MENTFEYMSVELSQDMIDYMKWLNNLLDEADNAIKNSMGIPESLSGKHDALALTIKDAKTSLTL